MKRRVEDTTKVEGAPPQSIPRVSHTTSSVVQTTYNTQTIKSERGETVTEIIQQFPIQSSYVAMPSITASSIKAQNTGGLQGSASHAGILLQPHIRPNKVQGSGGGALPSGGTISSSVVNTTDRASTGGSGTPQQVQRLKVEDALSYLDQVKYKFGNQPQVYNDFLDIMKEFKSQCIDTPGVIARVSNLFKGYPELISGFNTFLPPGYKIEVQANDTGYSLQVSVSMASPLGAAGGGTTHHTISDIPPLIQTQPSVVVPSQTTKPTVYGKNFSSSGLVTTGTSNSTLSGVPHIKQERSNSSSNLLATLPAALSASQTNSAQPLTANQTPVPPISAQQPPLIQGNHQTNQPVEFNHAINYVNKIKNRFQGQPDIYKRFLEVLHTYQKEQRTVKGVGGSGGGKQLTETEVYYQVAKLFEFEPDLLAEFGQFLPDATSHSSGLTSVGNKCVPNKSQSGLKYNSTSSSYNNKTSPASKTNSGTQSNKRTVVEVSCMEGRTVGTTSSSSSTPHPVKRQKVASSTPTLQHYANFDNIKRALRNQSTYDNILRCIYLYNEEMISRTELMILISPILSRFPDHIHWLREFLGTSDLPIPHSSHQSSNPSPPPTPQSELHNNIRPERTETCTSDIDFTSCKRIGASYCALPKNHSHPKCSGRTAVCKEVLNDTWVSFPTWSEEATFVTSRKTQYEEYIYRCEDERFELDLVIECNFATIRVLDSVQKRMSRMSPEELAKFKLDDTLGGTSSTIHIRALKRIYGDKAADIIDGLKKNPSIAVPVVLRRLKNKDIEWRQAQKGFNKIWREQNEKFYLKSLDHQGINFKQNDLKSLRSKSLYSEIESACDERNDGDEVKGQPHMVVTYRDKSVLDDAANLLIHHVKRQTAIHKHDKQKIKQLLRHALPDMFHHPRQQLSDDERDDDEKDDDSKSESENPSKSANGPLVESPPSGSRTFVKEEAKPDEEIEEEDKGSPSVPMKEEARDEDRTPYYAVSPYPDEEYTFFIGNNHWYLFLRLHQILCDRLAQMLEKSNKLAEEEAQFNSCRKESIAVLLRLKPSEHVGDCYSAMLEMVKGVLDCSIDPQTYEDTLRTMFGIHAFVGFTLDRVVTYAVRQLQQLALDEGCHEIWDLYLQGKAKGGTGGPCKTAHLRVNQEAQYVRNAAALLAGENTYKFFIYKKESKLCIELMDNECEDEEEANDEKTDADKWSSYVERLTDPTTDKLDPTLNVEDREKWGKAVYLRRNLRRWNNNGNTDENGRNVPGKMDVLDETQCKILPNAQRVYIVNKDSFIYRRKSLYKARREHNWVSKNLYRKFNRWHSKWSDKHLSTNQKEEARSWLMGLLPDTVPNKTNVLRDNPIDKPPYRPYNRYRVTYASDCVKEESETPTPDLSPCPAPSAQADIPESSSGSISPTPDKSPSLSN